MPTKPVSQPRDFKSSQPSVNESIVPTANPEVDDEIRKKMDQLKQQRGPSLLEQHQKKQAEKAKAAGDRPGSSGGWNRCVRLDLVAMRCDWVAEPCALVQGSGPDAAKRHEQR